MNIIIKKLMQNARFTVKEYEKGVILFHENDTCHQIGVVLQGKVQISSYSFFGNELVYSIIPEGEFFGDHLLFSSPSTYRGNVITLEKSRIGWCSKELFLSIFSSDPALLEQYFTKQAEKAIAQNTKIKLLSFDRAEERFLYYLSICHDEIDFDSITSLSQQLFLRRETLSRLLANLASKNIIQIEKKHIRKI